MQEVLGTLKYTYLSFVIHTTLLNSLKLRGKTPIRYVRFVSQNLIKNPFVQSMWYDMWAMMLNPPPQLPGCFFTCSNYWSTSQEFDLQVKKLVKSKYQPPISFFKDEITCKNILWSTDLSMTSQRADFVYDSEAKIKP